MIRKSDIQWWVLEAKKHPESAPAIIEELAERLTELSAENERLRGEIIQSQQHAPATVQSAELEDLRRKVSVLQSLLSGRASTEPSIVLFSPQLEAARLPLSHALQLASEGRPIPGETKPLGLRCLLGYPQDDLLLLTSHGHGIQIPLADIPLMLEEYRWSAVQEGKWAEGEQVTAAAVVGEPPRFWTLATRRGFVRQHLRIALDRVIDKGEPVVESPFHNDRPVTIVDGDQGDLLLITRWGQSARFPQRAIEGAGVTGLELEPDDEVVAALSLHADGEILLVTASGYAMRRDTSQFEARTRPGGAGKPFIQAYDVLGCFLYEPKAQLLFLTYSGKLVLVPAASALLHHRWGKGTQIHDLGRDPAVAVTLIPGTA